MKMWICRTKLGSLWLCEDKPKHDSIGFYDSVNFIRIHNRNLFPEVTFENSPMEVELKLIEK